jgi:hypothetical protein
LHSESKRGSYAAATGLAAALLALWGVLIHFLA